MYYYVVSIKQETVTNDNANVVTDYLQAMQIETNSSKNYTRLNKSILTSLSQFHRDKPFSNMKRNDIVAFLNSFRKSDVEDPMHKWIGTYNIYLIGIIRFFK